MHDQCPEHSKDARDANWEGRKNLTVAVAAKCNRAPRPEADVDLVLEAGTGSHVGLVHYHGPLSLFVRGAEAALRVLAHQSVRTVAAEQPREGLERPAPNPSPNVNVHVRVGVRGHGELQRTPERTSRVDNSVSLATPLQSLANGTVRALQSTKTWVVHRREVEVVQCLL